MKNIVVPILASFLAVSVLVAALSIMWNLKTRSRAWANDQETGTAMEIPKLLIFAFLSILTLSVPVHAQSQRGFISIDCGLPENSVYTEKKTGINYTSDVTFTDAGVSYNISSEYKKDTLEQPFLTVRSFPEGMRNCYTLEPAHGDVKFLIRASFMYGNYDGKNTLPRFDLLLGAEVWDSVVLPNPSTIVYKEIIHVPPKNHIDVCLVNKGSGTPFISSLELRPLQNSSYPNISDVSLLLYQRLDIGSTANANETYRFKDDVYDRIWSPYTRSNWVTLSSSFTLNSSIENGFLPPSEVMQTAAMPTNGRDSLVFNWKPSDPTTMVSVYFHHRELDENQTKNQTRNQNIYVNGILLYGPYTPACSYSFTAFSVYPLSGEEFNFSIEKTAESTLPPILNALELYQSKQFLQLLSNQDDVDAIMNIKREYGVKRNWQGDPCVPVKYLWQGLNCSYSENDFPRITSLNLSFSGIFGEISPYISDLTLIQSLDLSNNNLTGPVPDFLSELPFLTLLNLRGNNLQGLVPIGLSERAKNGLLLLSVDGNPALSLSTSYTKKKSAGVPWLEAFLAVSVLVATFSILLNLRKRSQGIVCYENSRSMEPKNRRFSYSDVSEITNNFEKIIGKGGFGTVYHGNLDDKQVAVKMLSLSSVQGHKEFQTEVELLLRVHHKNLTTLVGYCDDGTNMGLIYEFMANGNLESNLLDEGSSTADILSWEGRLRIATEAAQGLEYLHSGCKPPIVHRDIKPTNILLNEKFEAKIADFGLSRIFPFENETHVSTKIVGTPGYLDPEYYNLNRLTEKSDVYSFGVVLLQIITSKPAIERFEDRTHITMWVSSMLAEGDIEKVVDPRLQGDFNINSAWRVVEVAMTCISENSAKRPTMNQVVIDLSESLAIEIAHRKVGHEDESKDFLRSSISVNMDSELPPLAR